MENSNKSDLSITDFDCSDSDKDQNEQLSIERLQELNDDLTKENAELRSQFEEAVSISSKVIDSISGIVPITGYFLLSFINKFSFTA